VRPASGLLSSALKVGSPVVVALTAARALRLREVAVVNWNVCDSKNYAKRMEVRTGPSADGPWTPVAAFTSAQTHQRQTFPAAPDAPTVAGFVQVVVLDTYGGNANVTSVELVGDAWGPSPFSFGKAPAFGASTGCAFTFGVPHHAAPGFGGSTGSGFNFGATHHAAPGFGAGTGSGAAAPACGASTGSAFGAPHHAAPGFGGSTGSTSFTFGATAHAAPGFGGSTGSGAAAPAFGASTGSAFGAPHHAAPR
jgi:hypothetical protein